MDESIREALGTEILDKLNGLSELEAGTKEYQMALDNVVKLYRLGLDDARIENDANDKYYRNELESQKHEDELKNREQQAEEQKKDQLIKYGFEGAKILLPMIFYGIWMRRGFKFEETGTFTSTTFRGLFNRFRPTDK